MWWLLLVTGNLHYNAGKNSELSFAIRFFLASGILSGGFLSASPPLPVREVTAGCSAGGGVVAVSAVSAVSGHQRLCNGSYEQ